LLGILPNFVLKSK